MAKRGALGWIGRAAAWGLGLALLGGAGVAGAYYGGVQLPVHSDVAAFVLQNWNKTRPVDVEASHYSSLVRRDGRIHVTVDLALPQVAQRVQAFMDGGRTMLLDCGPQQVYMHNLQNAVLTVDGPVIGIEGLLELETAGLFALREGRQVSATVRTGFDRQQVWADVTSLRIEGLPDPMVEPILRELARVTYTREQVLDLAAGGLSPELAGLLAEHRDALDLAFEDIVVGSAENVLTLQAVFSVDEDAAFGMIGDALVDAGGARARMLARMAGPAAAHAQGLGQIGDLLDRMGGGDARRIIEDGLVGGGLRDLEDVIGSLADFTDCRTAF